MIILTRLAGRELAINPDLIERAEATPDTVITMVDGSKLVVTEGVAEVVARIRTWRASVASEAFTISSGLQHDDDDPAHRAAELGSGDVSAHTAFESSLARVLRLPQREE